MMLKTLGIFDEIRKYIPVITEKVLDFLESPENRDKLKGFVIQKLDEYTANAFAEVDYTYHNEVLANIIMIIARLQLPGSRKRSVPSTPMFSSIPCLR
ncbi:MAG: hypothetical protein WDO14_16635 [Bacteroidota bacterium]